MKTRKQWYNSRITTNCYGKVTSKECECIYVSVIVTDSVFKSIKSYQPQKTLEEWKTKMKKKETKLFITANEWISSDDDEQYFEETSE